MNLRSMHSWTTAVCLALLAITGTVTAQDAPATPAAPAPPSLFERLGGLAPISVVVNDFIDVLVPDAVLNANPAIDAARKRVPPPYLKFHITTMVCQVTGGPCQYSGRGMKESHAHLNISEQEWDRMVVLFKEVLAKHNVPTKESDELIAIVGSTKGDIVTAKPTTAPKKQKAKR